MSLGGVLLRSEGTKELSFLFLTLASPLGLKGQNRIDRGNATGKEIIPISAL